MRESQPGQPLAFSKDFRLDHSLRTGVDAWEAMVSQRGAAATTTWLMDRSAGAGLDEELVLEAVENLIVSEDPHDRALARAEIAEIAQEEDTELADILWFAVRDYGIETGDADLIVEASTHLAEIALDLDEPTTAAEVWLDFLNWRREPDATSDPESVLTAFDEIISAAELDGAREVAARFGYMQVQFQQLVDADDPRTTVGNWLSNDDPLESWS